MVKLLCSVMFAMVFLVSGCSTNGTQPGVDGENLAASLAIQYATLRVIEEAENPANVAMEVEQVALEALEMVEDGSVSLVSELEERIRERIDWVNMEPSRQLVANVLLSTIRVELGNRIGGGSLSPQEVLLVAQALNHVISTARLNF